MKTVRFILVALIVVVVAGCNCPDKTKQECMTEFNLKDTCIIECEVPSAHINDSGLPWGFVSLDAATTAAYCSTFNASPGNEFRGVKIQPHIINYLVCEKKATEIILNFGKDGAGNYWPIYTYKTGTGVDENLGEDPTDTIPEVKCPPTCIPPR